MDKRVFMGNISPEEFRRMYEGDFRQHNPGSGDTRRSTGGGQQRSRGRAKVKDYTAAPWRNPLDRLQWQAVYSTATVQYKKDYTRNELTVTVPEYHRQTYKMDEVIQGYINHRRRMGDSWQAIRHGSAATGRDMGLIFRWLVDTGQFPYPYEVAIGVGRHYIDMKLLL
jgi:hypothetical protein